MDNKDKIARITGALIALLQGVSALGVSGVALWADYLTKKETAIIAVGSALLGIVSAFLPSVRKAEGGSK